MRTNPLARTGQSPTTVVSSPHLLDWLATLRSPDVSRAEARSLVHKITSILFGTACDQLMETKRQEIMTPLCTMNHEVLDHDGITLNVVMRAALGLLNACLEYEPDAGIGFIYAARDESTEEKSAAVDGSGLSADTPGRPAFLLEVMLASGGTLLQSIKLLLDAGATDVTIICLIASSEGIEAVRKVYPEVQIFCAAIDDRLNADMFIVPGLGDAGDKMYGPKLALPAPEAPPEG